MDPHAILGVDANDPLDLVRERRRRLASVHHPDVGGDAETMAAINRAFDLIIEMRQIAEISQVAERSQSDEMRSPARHSKRPTTGFDVDRPSFVVDALPAVAFEVLLLAARSLGDVADEDPPYVIEMQLEDPPLTWCRLEIVPDAGSSTVSIITDGTASADDVRDLLVSTVNELDVSNLE